MLGVLKNRWRLAMMFIALPIFFGMTYSLPNLDAPDLLKFPPEQLVASTSNLKISDILGTPEHHWKPLPQGWAPNTISGVSELWWRFKIPPASKGTPERLNVDAGAFLFPEVDFYLVDGRQVVRESHQGLDRSLEDGMRNKARHTFAVEQHQSRPLEIFIRISSEAFLVTPIVMRTELRAQYIDWQRNIFRGILLGSLLGLAIYNLTLSLHLKQKTYSSYAMFLFCVVALGGLLNSNSLKLFGMQNISFDMWIKFIVSAAFFAIATFLKFTASFIRLQRHLPALASKVERLVNGSFVLAVCSLVLPKIMGIVLLMGAIPLVVLAVVLLTIPRINIPEFFDFTLASSGILFSAVVQMVAVPISARTVLGVDGVFLVGALWGAGFLSLAIGRQAANVDEQYQRIATALMQGIPKTALNNYLDDSFSEQIDKAELTVTIMFIDIASFSRVADLVEPKEMFYEISRRLESIAKIVLDHGGTIDRTLGDGILCFFGYKYKASSDDGHAKQAFDAATKIQRSYLLELQESNKKGSKIVPLPVRIGIHTDKVTIGNMGTVAQVDFTMVGNGVNFTNRLESACGPNRIMVSSRTRKSLIRSGFNEQSFESVLISVKHHPDLVEAYEVNPLADKMKELSEIQKIFMERLGEKVRYERYGFSDKRPVIMSCQYGVLVLKDFSKHGFLLRGNVFLAQKSIIQLTIDTQDPVSNQTLHGRGVDTIEVEVRWSRKIGDEYDHGVQVIGGHSEQWNMLFEILMTINHKLLSQVA